MKQIIRRIAALVIGLGLGATALAGLESVTHISDLNSAWPLGSDLASTSDDHIRNIKVALKTDFPNVNAAVTPTPTQFNQLTTDTFTNLAVTSSTIPVNGIYLPAANTLGFASNTTKWGSVNSTGNWVFVVPTSGTSLTVPVLSGATGIAFGKTKFGDDLLATGADLFSTTDVMSVGTTGAAATNLYTNSAARLQIASAGNVTVNAPSSGNTFTSNAVATAFAGRFNGTGTAGQSFGVQIVAGSNSTDQALQIINQAVSANLFVVRGDGAIQGAGPVAAGLVDMTPDTGTFTITLVGGTTSPTPTVKFSRVGRLVILVLPNTSFTSNSSGFSATGVPASLRPTTSIAAIAPIGVMQDNSTEAANCLAGINSSGTITFYKASAVAANWTSVGNKGIGSPSNVTAGNFMVYSLD